jgi:hypothetical protein
MEINGSTSDGYHTFDELYNHRCVLFSALCNQNKNLAWKSRLHHDGTMFDGMFIVGIQTPFGQCTYHYDMEHWDLFRVPETATAPLWDGHSANDVVERIKSWSKVL